MCFRFISCGFVDRSLVLMPAGKLRRSPTTHETVAHAHNGFNAIATLVQFLTQAPDMNVESARIAIITVAPDAIQKLLAEITRSAWRRLRPAVEQKSGRSRIDG